MRTSPTRQSDLQRVLLELLYDSKASRILSEFAINRILWIKIFREAGESREITCMSGCCDSAGEVVLQWRLREALSGAID